MIPPQYMNGICSEQVKEYCKSIGKAGMYENLVRMAATYTVPSRGQVTDEIWATFSRDKRKSLSGYGPVELIGEPDCVPYYVPFIRHYPSTMTESAFWLAPTDQAGIGLESVSASSSPSGLLYRRSSKRPQSSTEKTSITNFRRKKT